MVGAGFPATVAPLGTALTEEQLALLWRMTDEPMLCFDGDAAGRRAAYRAVDLALPQLKPGKSLLFAMLPQGQDPDDLVRSGGREAIDEVLEAARPLAEMLWLRETESGNFETPERRAALESRLAGLTRSIGDESVRKYYRDDLSARLRNLFAPAEGAAPREPWGSFPRGRGRERGRRPANPREALRAVSPRLGASPILRGFRSGLAPREALILLTVANHPWLLEKHAEELAELEFRHPDAEKLARAILDAGSHGPLDPDELAAQLAAAGLAPVLARITAAITHTSDWPARAGAAPDDVASWWAHVVTLHRKSRTLHRELRDAERALGTEPSEENFAWLRDVQERLSALAGSEAEIEGFGASSGRPVRTY